MPVMPRLHQLIARLTGQAETVPPRIDHIKRELGKQQLLTGLSRTYQPRDDDGEKLPPEATRVQLLAKDALSEAVTVLSRYYDANAARENANTTAHADIVVGGAVLLANVPVTYLLFLERELAKTVDGLVKALPVLDPAEDWEWDANRGCFATPPAGTTRSKKVPRNHVLAEATDKHPAQVQVYMEDVAVGDWSTTKFSGAMEADKVRRIRERLAVLLDAVRSAREEANATEISGPAADPHVGEAVFGYLLG
jgi:hypothetical protein